MSAPKAAWVDFGGGDGVTVSERRCVKAVTEERGQSGHVPVEAVVHHTTFKRKVC